MADVLESLEIQVKHNASGADAAINDVANAVTNLKNALGGTPAALRDLANAMTAMSNAFKGGSAKLTSFASGIADIAAATQLLGNGAQSLSNLAVAVTAIASSGFDPSALKGLAKALEDLVRVVPSLAAAREALTDLATSLSSLGGASASITAFANALTTLSTTPVSAGAFRSLAAALTSLNTALTTISPNIGILTAFASAMSGLAGVAFDPSGIVRLAGALTRMSTALPALSAQLPVITALAGVLGGLSGLTVDTRMLNGIARAITNIVNAAATITPDVITNLNNLITALGLLSTLSLGDVVAQLNAISQTLPRVASAANRVNGSTRNAGRGIRSMGDEAKKSSGALATLFSSLKRIAFYRIIRAIIKAITDAFKKGSENAYFFSESVSGMGNRFATALDGISTKALTMKNQLGSAFNALMTAIAPVIEYLIGLIAKLADAISQLFSVFTGTTYLKAVDVPNKWATETNKATKEAKEWKNQLLGFDEINRLDEPSNSGGSGKDELDPKTMFEDTEINPVFLKIKQTLKDFVDSIDFKPLKQSWEELKESAKELAAVIKEYLGWAWDNILKPMAKWTMEKFTPSFVNTLSAAIALLGIVLVAFKPFGKWLWENFLQPLANFVGDSILNFLEELKKAFENLSSVLRGDTSWSDFIRNISATEVALFGFVALLTGFAASGLIRSVIGFITKRLATPFGRLSATIILAAYAFGEVKEAIELFNQTGAVTPEIIGKILKALGAVTIAVGLFTSPWVAVAGVAVWAAGWIVENWQLVKTTFTNIVNSIKTAFSGLSTHTSNQGSIITSVFEGIKTLWESVAEVIENKSTAISKAVTGIKKIFSALKWVVQLLWVILSAVFTSLSSLLDTLFKAISGYVSAILSTVIDVVSGVLEALGGLVDFIAGVFTGDWERAWTGIKEFFEGIWRAIKGVVVGTFHVITTTVSAAIGVIGWLLTMLQNVINKILEFLGLWDSTRTEVSRDFDPQTGATTYTLDDGSIIKVNAFHAAGGFAETGEIFVARERGPEMVGTIGNRTAIANNDQIVEGIRQGVFEAVSAAMSNKSGGTQEIKVYLDSREIRAGQQRLNRAWGA